MRVKNFVSHLHIRTRAKLIWSRITLSRLTTAYFAITAIHCIVQIIFQSHAFSINASAADSLFSLLVQAGETNETQGLAIYSNNHDLHICYLLPNKIDQCNVIWSEGQTAAPVPAQPSPDDIPASASVPSPVAQAQDQAQMTPTPSTSVPVTLPTSTTPLSRPNVPITATPFISTPITTGKPEANSVDDDAGDGLSSSSVNSHGTTVDDQGDNDGFASIVQKLTPARDKRRILVVENSPDIVTVTGINGLDKSTQVNLTKTCIKTLIWPVQKLDNTKREDITIIGFQIWVMTMSLVALLNESIPHIFAAVVTQTLVAIWTIEEIFETESFRDDFVRLTVNGACQGHNLLGSYWSERKNAEITSAVLNGIDVFLIGFLTYKLVKIYSWQTYKRIGASLMINRVYKLVLCLSVAIQLALFFIVVAAGLWLDQLLHGAAARLSDHRTLYIVFLSLTACSLVPWLSLGWFAIRREMRKACAAFLVINVAFILIWAALYGSNSFRWTFSLWSFFAVMSVAAGILIACTLGLGLACRLNFGKGLPQYLNVQESVDGVDFAPVLPDGQVKKALDLEKVDFPSFGGPSPTFSTFNQPSDTLRIPDKAIYSSHQRSGSKASSTFPHLARTDTSMSNTSQSSTDSNRKMGKRILIE